MAGWGAVGSLGGAIVDNIDSSGLGSALTEVVGVADGAASGEAGALDAPAEEAPDEAAGAFVVLPPLDARGETVGVADADAVGFGVEVGVEAGSAGGATAGAWPAPKLQPSTEPGAGLEPPAPVVE